MNFIPPNIIALFSGYPVLTADYTKTIDPLSTLIRLALYKYKMTQVQNYQYLILKFLIMNRIIWQACID